MGGLTDLQIKQRIGCLTASRMKDARAMLKKGGEAEARYAYKVELVTERLTGIAATHYVNVAMQRGIDLEDAAKEAYEIANGVILGPADLYQHPSIKWFAGTPDSVTAELLHEFKVPQPSTFVRWLLDDQVPPEHVDQLIAQQACTVIRHSIFVAFCPEMPENLRLFVREFRATDEQIATCEEDARRFLQEVEGMYKLLTAGVAA
jgi:hypothetical protein